MNGNTKSNTNSSIRRDTSKDFYMTMTDYFESIQKYRIQTEHALSKQLFSKLAGRELVIQLK